MIVTSKTIIISLLSKIIIADNYHQLIENHHATKLWFFMITLDINSLFTHILLDTTINICMDLVFKENKIQTSLSDASIISKESIILFDNKY